MDGGMVDEATDIGELFAFDALVGGLMSYGTSIEHVPKSVSRSSHARVSAAGLAPIQPKLSRNSNQIARGRIRQFES